MSFTIGKKFKAGADGILYQGDNGLGRTVAIKIIGPSCGDPEFVKRQAEALARVESPHVVDVIVVAEFDDPADPGTTRHGIVMEWLDGQTFREIIAGSVLKPGESASE